MNTKIDRVKVRTFLLLIGIMCMVLFLNSYFNYTSGIAYNSEGTTIGTRFFLSGPDPYYNMRLAEETMRTGQYPFFQPHQGNADPLLNYPVGERGARPPLFVMIAVSVASVVSNFMPPMDALGWSMLFLPAVYGALMVLPLYGIAKELFNRKVALITAVLLPLVPIHISGGHGSSLALFDHDSFLQLLFLLTFYFIIKGLREKNGKRSMLYGALAGLPLAGIYLTWVANQYIFILLAITLTVIFVFDSFKKNYKDIIPYATIYMAMFVSFCISLPYALLINDYINYQLFALTYVALLTGSVYFIKKLKMPWIVIIPAFAIVLASGALALYLIASGMIPMKPEGVVYAIATTIFGTGIYGTKISLTIAEAGSFQLSQTVMSIGPILYWVGCVGFVLYIYKSFKEKFPAQNIFIISIFLVSLWLLTTAGRFLNDLMPHILIFSGFLILLILDRINYKQMVRTIRSVGGLHGLKKGFRYTHLLGILFIFFLFLSNSYLALDASVPSSSKKAIFGENYSGYFGQSFGQSYYWSDACAWLAQQDTNITEDGKKPAVISWWDYGFYLSSMSKHPTVADNYQDGIPPASNFHTAKSEQEAIAVLIIRVCEGAKKPTGMLPQNVKDLFLKYLPAQQLSKVENNQTINYTITPGLDVINILDYPEKAPSFDKLIAPQYGNTQLRINKENAMYQDATSILMNLSDDGIVSLYEDVQKATGFSIRYYAVEQYDTQIFGVFTFLADKGVEQMTGEDDYFILKYLDRKTGNKYTIDEFELLTEEQKNFGDWTTTTEYKTGFFNTMFYMTYYGTQTGDGSLSTNRMPTYGLRHFYLAYYSPYVVIAKYYPGAKIFGNAQVANILPLIGSYIYVTDNQGIIHDIASVGNDGTYNLLIPPGNSTLSIYKDGKTIGKSVNVSTTIDEAMRIGNYSKRVDFFVNSSSLFLDINSNTTDLNLTLSNPLVSLNRTISMQNQSFLFESLIPGEYRLLATNSTKTFLDKTIYLYPDENRYTENITGNY